MLCAALVSHMAVPLLRNEPNYAAQLSAAIESWAAPKSCRRNGDADGHC